MEDKKKYYEIKIVVQTIQILTILLIAMTTIEIILKAMLVFGYVMLFNQKKWHKHLLIMFIMILMLFVSSDIMIK